MPRATARAAGASTTTIGLGMVHTSDSRANQVLLVALLVMMGVLGILIAWTVMFVRVAAFHRT